MAQAARKLQSPEELARWSEEEAKRLERLYSEAEKEILREVNRGLLKGNNTKYLQGVLRNVRAILKDLRNGSRQWCEDAIPRIYSAGIQTADKQIVLLPENKRQGTIIYDAQGKPISVIGNPAGGDILAGFGAIHQQAVKVLAENVYDRFDHVAQVIGRRVDDLYRQLALESIRGTVAGYQSWQQVARNFREKLAEKGITGFTDAAGRNWNMVTYSQMVARTSTMEAHLQGTANRLLEYGHDLVKISTHTGACEKCAPWQGKILSLTGKTPGYPTLADAQAAGLFHPNCRHAYGLYLPELEEGELGNRKEKQTGPPPAFKALGEAKVWAQARYPNIKWEFDGAHIDTINATVKQFHILAEKYPDVVAKMEYIGTKRLFSFNEYAHATTDGKVFGLNPTWYGDPDRFKKSMEKDVWVGFHPKGCDTFESVLTHEFGHQVNNWLLAQQNIATLPVVSDDGLGLVGETVWRWQATHFATADLSRYATTNHKEAWAEAFSAIYHGAGEATDFQKDLQVLLEVVDKNNWGAVGDFKRLSDLPPGPERDKAIEGLAKLEKKLGVI